MYDQLPVLCICLYILIQMVEGVPPFSKSPEEIAKLMTLDDKRLALKMKSKSFPPDLKK